MFYGLGFVSCEGYMIFLPSKESTSIGIICENYTPHGVVVVDVVTTKESTMVMVVEKEVVVLLFIILFKNSIFCQSKKCSMYFYEYHNFRLVLRVKDFFKLFLDYYF